MPRLILQVDAKQAASVVAALNAQMGGLGVTVQTTAARLGAVGNSARRTGGAFDQLHRTGTQVGHMFLRMGAAMAGLAFLRLGSEVTQAWVAMDRFSRTFRAGAGDALQGGQELEFVREQSHRLGLDFEATADAYSRFMVALRLSGVTIGETRKIFVAVSEAATVLGLSSQRTQSAFLALEQMASKGKVSMEELRRQLGQHIPGAMQIAAAAIGKTIPELFKMVETGQLLSKDFLPKFAAELKKTFGPELANALDSPQVAFGRLKTAFFELKVAAGDELVPALTELTRFLYELSRSDEAKDSIRSLSEAFVRLGQDIGNLFGEGSAIEDIQRVTEFFRSIERVLNNIVRMQNDQPVILDLPGGWEKFQAWLHGAPQDTEKLKEKVKELEEILDNATAAGLDPSKMEAVTQQYADLLRELNEQSSEGGEESGSRWMDSLRAGIIQNPYYRWLADFPEMLSALWSKLDNPFLKLFEDAERQARRARRDLEKLERGDISVLSPGIKGLPDSLEDAIEAMKKAGLETSKLEKLLRSGAEGAQEWTDQQKKLIEGWRDEATVAAHVASKIGEGELAMWRAETAGKAFLAIKRAETIATSELGKFIQQEIFEREIHLRTMKNEATLRKNNETLIKNETAALRDYLAEFERVQEEQGQADGGFLTAGPTFTAEDIGIAAAEAELNKFREMFERWLERKNQELEKIPAEFRFLFKPTYEDFVSEIQEQWSGAILNMAEVWRGFVEGVQDIFADTFKQLFRGNLDSWEDLWKAVKDLALDTLSEIAAKWATQKFVMNITDNSGTSLNWGSIAKLFGGGTTSFGDSTSLVNAGVMGPTQSGGNAAAGGGGSGWASTAGAWASVAVIVAGIGFAMGWWGKSGKQGIGGVNFGGAGGFDINDTWSAGSSKNIGPVLEKVKAAIAQIKEFMVEVDLEILALGDTVVQKQGKSYTVLARGITSDIRAALGQIDTAGMTAEELYDAIATLAIRTAEFGPSVSEFLKAVIRGSEAITQEQLKAEIELARMVEGFGKTDLENQIQRIGREIDGIFQQLVRLLGENIEQLSFGLNQTVLEEVNRWNALRRSITGEEASQAELLEIKKREAALFNAEKALRVAELKSRVELLKSEIELAKRRSEFRRGELVAMVKLETGFRQLGLAELKAGHRNLGIRGQLYEAEQRLTQSFFETTATIVSAAAAALEVELKALNDLIAALENIPDIDLTKIKLPKVGGGAGDDIKGDRERLRDILDSFNISLMGEVEQAIRGINDRYEENKKLAHGDAELLGQVNKMREEELRLLQKTLRAEVEPFIPSIQGTVTGPDGQVLEFGGDESEWQRRAAEIEEWAKRVAEDNERLLKETGEAALETWEIIAAEANRMRLLVEEAIGSLGLPLEETRAKFKQLEETLAFLREQVDKGILSYERYAEVVAQVAAAEFLGLGDALMGFVERYYGNVAGFEDFRMQLEQARFAIEFANLQLQFQLLQELGLLTKEQIELIQGVIDYINENPPTFPNLPTAPTVPTTPTGPSIEDLNQERERALEILQGFLDLELSPYERELKELTETFDELRRVLGNTVDVQRAWELALKDLNERYTQGLRDFLDTLRDPSLTQAQQFEAVRERFLALAATGDISQSDELLRLAEQLRTLGASALGTAGGGFQALLDLIEAQILMFLGEGGVPGAPLPPGTQLNTAGGPGAAGAEAVSVVSSVNRGNSLLERIEQVLIAVEHNTASLNQASGFRGGAPGTNEDQLNNYLRLAAQNTAETTRELRQLRDEARERSSKLPVYAVDFLTAQGGQR